MSWLRLYDSVPEDPKVQRLPDALFKFWVNMLCIAKRNGGPIGAVEDISWVLREKPERVQAKIDALAQAGLLDAQGEVYRPHNWDRRQFSSDASTERVRKFRERHLQQEGNVSPEVSQSFPASGSVSDSVSDSEFKERSSLESFDAFKFGSDEADKWLKHGGRGIGIRMIVESIAAGESPEEVAAGFAKWCKYFAAMGWRYCHLTFVQACQEKIWRKEVPEDEPISARERMVRDA